MLSLVATTTLVLSLIRLVSVAPTQNVVNLVTVENLDNKSGDRDPIYIDLCQGLYLEEPCLHAAKFVQGACGMINRGLMTVSSMRYDEGITCTLYNGNMCDVPGSFVLDHIVLPYDVISDLSRVGWNKKANSIYCKWKDADLKARNSLAIAAPIEDTSTHHRDHDPMYIDICDDIYFEGECLRRQKLFQGDCGKIENMGVSSIDFSDNLICFLYESSNCGIGDSLPNVILRGRVDDLRNIGWNDRASSVACLFADDIFEEGSPLVTGPPLLARNTTPVEDIGTHHRDNEYMHIFRRHLVRRRVYELRSESKEVR